MHNKKIPSIVAIFAATIAVFSAVNFARAADSCNDHIVISQIYGGGGNSGALYKNDFIELYNPTENAVPVNDWSVQYATTSGSFSTANTTNLSGTIKAKSYYLIAETKGSGGTEELPIPDKSGTINLSASAGRVALVRATSVMSSQTDPSIADFVNYSSGSNTKGIFRDLASCPNTFSAATPNPRNSTAPESSDNDTAGEPADDTSNDIKNSSEKCAASSKDIKLNELFPYPSSGNEFIEIINIGENCVDVSGWKVMDEADHKKTFPENSIIQPGGYLYLEGNLYLNNDSDTAYLLDTNGSAKNDALDKVFYDKAKENYSYALSDGSFFWTSAPTPGEKNIITIPKAAEKNTTETNNTQEATENYTSDANIYLNEIMPNPKDGSDNEYIEIASGGTESIDLFGWRIKDVSKSKGYQFKEHIILNPGEYLAIYRPDSKIALNNSNESIYLSNPKNEIVSSVSFEKSQKGASYNFDGENWKWSKYLTPGKENKFDSPPKVDIKKIKYAYKDLFTEFSAKVKDKETKKLKYSWDFGDGSKSTLAKTSHKYLATGKFAVTLSVSDDSQTVEKSFSIEVKKYPRPNVEIVKMVPNPAGKDEDGEIIDIRNNSGNKIDLSGWKIATGTGEKMLNHPISGEFALGSNETKTITHKFSKFSLNNKAGKVQLVMPDGKVIDEIEYAKEKITDDEAYAKIDGDWQWIAPDAQDENIAETNIDSADQPIDEEAALNEGINTDGEVLGATDIIETATANYNPSFSSEDAFIFLSDIGFLKLQNKEINYCPLKNTTASLEYFLISSI